MILDLASARTDIAGYVGTLITVYIVLIFIRILMSWIPRMPYYRWLDAVLTFITEVTDPFLNVFRRVLPPLRLGGAALDLSPIVAVIVLGLLRTIVVNAIHG